MYIVLQTLFKSMLNIGYLSRSEDCYAFNANF